MLTLFSALQKLQLPVISTTRHYEGYKKEVIIVALGHGFEIEINHIVDINPTTNKEFNNPFDCYTQKWVNGDIDWSGNRIAFYNDKDCLAYTVNKFEAFNPIN